MSFIFCNVVMLDKLDNKLFPINIFCFSFTLSFKSKSVVQDKLIRYPVLYIAEPGLLIDEIEKGQGGGTGRFLLLY